MVIRLLLRYLANNERLVQRLSESYPIQKAARLAVYLFNRGKGIAEEQDLKGKLESVRIREFIKKFSSNVKEEIRKVKEKK